MVQFLHILCQNFPTDFTHKYVENLHKSSIRSQKLNLLPITDGRSLSNEGWLYNFQPSIGGGSVNFEPEGRGWSIFRPPQKKQETE